MIALTDVCLQVDVKKICIVKEAILQRRIIDKRVLCRYSHGNFVAGLDVCFVSTDIKCRGKNADTEAEYQAYSQYKR